MSQRDPFSAAVRGGVPDHGRTPKSFEAKASLLALLQGLREGQALPPERDLAEQLALSRATIRQALQDLLLDGRVKRQGRSTVVTGPKLVQPLALRSYTEGIRAQGKRPDRVLVTREQLAADQACAEVLGVAPGAPLIHLERILLADDERVGLESTYLPSERVPDLIEDFDPSGSLYRYLREVAGIEFGDADERIETVLATPREAGLVGSSPSLPMLLLNRLTRDVTGRPVERVRALYRGDRFSFTTHLSR